MAKKKIKQTSSYWRDWKPEELHQNWSALVVEAKVKQCERLQRIANIYKNQLDFINWGMPKIRHTRHTRPPLILFNKTLTNRYIVYSDKGFIFAQPKITILI